MLLEEALYPIHMIIGLSCIHPFSSILSAKVLAGSDGRKPQKTRNARGQTIAERLSYLSKAAL